MSEDNLYHPSEKAKKVSLINEKYFSEKYDYSIELNDKFWSEEGKKIEWIKPFSKVKDVSYDLKDLHIRWFYDGSLNVSSNCLDRHLEARGNQIAIIWEGDDPNDTKKITYRELHEEVCKFSNALKANGAKKVTG